MSNGYGIKNRVINWIRLGASYIILAIVAIIAVFPIYYIIITSVNPIPTLASVSVSYTHLTLPTSDLV